MNGCCHSPRLAPTERNRGCLTAWPPVKMFVIEAHGDDTTNLCTTSTSWPAGEPQLAHSTRLVSFVLSCTLSLTPSLGQPLAV